MQSIESYKTNQRLGVSGLLSIQRILFFMNQYMIQLKKRWATLLLLLLLPVLLVGLTLRIVASLLVPEEEAAIRVALVDEDGTKESQLFSKVLEETASGDALLQIVTLPRETAEQFIHNNEISAYFSFPEGFTADLYTGVSVTLPIIGNPEQPMESLVVKELVESMSRLLATAQANILTINTYAKQTDMTKEERYDLMLKQFIDFTLYTLGKNKLLDEEVLTNAATASPTQYYLLAGWFILLTIWLLVFYIVTGKEEHATMQTRMRLIGVTLWQRLFARILLSLLGGCLAGGAVFFIVKKYIPHELFMLDYFRLGLYVLLYALLFLVGLALLDVWVPSERSALLMQSLYVVVLLLASGAFIPTVYFPQAIQEALPLLFSNESLKWMMDIALEERNYANYTNLVLLAGVGLAALWLSSAVKERWSA